MASKPQKPREKWPKVKNICMSDWKLLKTAEFGKPEWAVLGNSQKMASG